MAVSMEQVVAASPARPALTAREALAAEWRAADPQTPEQIHAFYTHSHRIAADLSAWHASEARGSVTAMLVHVAKTINAGRVVDIGCGAGHDLKAIAQVLPTTTLAVPGALFGVEPNDRFRSHLGLLGFHTAPAVADAPIETADLLICIDVLEHVVDPESFLTALARRAPIGCVLFEATATFDTGTPLHLAANRGWHPGRCLERCGWEQIDRADRVRVWRRETEAGQQRASMLLCAHRSVSAEHLTAVLRLCAGDEGWRLRTKVGDALIARSRAIVVTSWWRETNDDVFLMVDDDVTFATADADRLADLCRAGHDLICGAYPVHDGGHLACRFLPGTGDVHFGPSEAPLEIEYAATGFLAVHRRVIDALVATLPLCHADQPWSFYPLFATLIREHPTSGHEWLSEDWGMCQLARDAGFRVWLDPQTRLKHLGSAAISVSNMAAMHDAIARV